MSSRFKSLIGDKPFYKKVLAISIPIMLQNGVTHLVNLLDNVMVGSLGTESMSGVSIVNQFVFIFNLLIFGAVSAGGIFTAQYHGLGDDEGVRNTFRLKMILNLFLSVAAIILFLTLDDWLISTFLHSDGGTGEIDPVLTLNEGKAYLGVFVIGLIPYAITQVYASTLREVEETKLPMYASVIALSANFVLNIVFIFALGMGVRGAAIATVISRFLELAFIVVRTHKNSGAYTFINRAYRSFRLPPSLVKGVLIRGLPLMANEFLWSISITLRNQAYSTRGLDAVAAINISTVIINLINVVYMALGCSIAIIVGERLGAGRIEEAKATATKTLAFSLFTAVLSGIVMAAVAPVFPMIYETTDSVRSLATYMTLISAALIPFCAFAYCTYFVIRTGGRVFLTFMMDCGIMWSIVIPISLVLANFTPISIELLFLIGQGAEAVKLIPGLIILKKGSWAKSLV
jgi:putative MATE family efflux protein